MFDPPTNWTIADIAVLLGTTPQLPYAWIQAGRLRASKDPETETLTVALADLQSFLRGRPGSVRPQKVPTTIDWDAVPRSLPTAKAANLVGLSASYVALLVKGGSIKAKRVAGRYRIHRDELRRFVEQRHADGQRA